MKKIFLIITVSLFYQLSFSQGNLEFNRIVNETFTLSRPAYAFSNAGNITIPDGKVWKIEYLSYINSSGGELYSSYITLGDFSIHNYSPTGASQNFPFWLPNGSFDIKYFNGSAINSPPSVIIKISAIEFNVAPINLSPKPTKVSPKATENEIKS